MNNTSIVAGFGLERMDINSSYTEEVPFYANGEFEGTVKYDFISQKLVAYQNGVWVNLDRHMPGVELHLDSYTTDLLSWVADKRHEEKDLAQKRKEIPELDEIYRTAEAVYELIKNHEK